MSKCRGQGSGTKMQISNLAELPVDPKLMEMILNGQIQVVYNLNAKKVLQTQSGGEPDTGFITGTPTPWYMRNPQDYDLYDSWSVPNSGYVVQLTRTIPANRMGFITHVYLVAGSSVPSAGNHDCECYIIRADGDTHIIAVAKINTADSLEFGRGDGKVQFGCMIPVFEGDQVNIRTANGGAGAETMAGGFGLTLFDAVYKVSPT